MVGNEERVNDIVGDGFTSCAQLCDRLFRQLIATHGSQNVLSGTDGKFLLRWLHN